MIKPLGEKAFKPSFSGSDLLWMWHLLITYIYPNEIFQRTSYVTQEFFYSIIAT